MPKNETLKKDWRFSYRVLLPIILAVTITLAILGSFMFWTATRNDEVAISRQLQLVSHVFEQQKTLIKQEQENVAAWSKAVAAVQGDLDLNWIEENLGKGMYEYFGHERAWLIDPNLNAVYVMKDGKSVSPKNYEASRETLEPFVSRLKEINWQGAFSSYIYGHTGVIPNIVDIAMIEGNPAIISLMPVATDERVGKQGPGKEYIHIVAEFLNDEIALELYNILLLKGGHFSINPLIDEGEVVLDIRNKEGKVITNFIWKPDYPGVKMFLEIMPILLVIALIAIFIITLLILRLHQSTAELEKRRSNAQHLAYHDALTGLGNRAMFEENLSETLSNIKTADGSVALLILDLDRFKIVNDTLGHQAGDELICEVAERLQPLVRDSDVITRLGGDEFAIIIKDVNKISDIEVVCARMVKAISKPFNLKAGQAFVGVSIGVSIASNSSYDGEEITRQADIALYEAKGNGRNQFIIFEDRMNEEVQQRQFIENELRKALVDKNQLQVIFEHLVRKNGSEIIGVEAKLEWQHPKIGIIEPEVFLPIAETCGLIDATSEFLLNYACKAGAKTPNQIMAVRIFSSQLRNPHFFGKICNIIKKTGILPTDLELEIDEKTLSNADGVTMKNIHALRKKGIRIALGDFGTGFSSLRLLQQFQVDRIKISRSFIEQLAQSPDPEAITHAVVWLARAIGVEVTADGIDTLEQKNFLARMGCMSFQGALFSASSQAEWLKIVLDNAGVTPKNQSQIEDRIEVWDDFNTAS